MPTGSIKTYSELRQYHTFDDRLQYLRLYGSVAHATFGYDRYINQQFYHSYEWINARNAVIVRDNGCDLGISGHEIHEDILVHHMNPMNQKDIIDGEAWILDPEYLITTTQMTHNIIHYGDRDLYIPPTVVERVRGDTKLW